MNNHEQIFFSEDPESDIWNSLKNYSYNGYLEEFFSKRNTDFEQNMLDTISGSLVQAFEYFEASKIVSLQTSPLLLYYGTINLLYAATCLKKGRVVEIIGHGLSLIKSTLDDKNLLDIEIQVYNKKGSGLKEYINSLSETQIDQRLHLKLGDILSSIPELYREYADITKEEIGHILPLIERISEDFTVYVSKLDMNQSDSIENIINSESFKNTFLQYQKNGKGEYIFYLKLGKENDIKKSFLGEYYLQLELANTPTINPMFLGVMALYVLATVSRYHTEVWNSFIKNNRDGLVNFIEKFLNMMRRYFPNYILDIIENKKHKFTNQVIPTEDFRNQLSEKELEQKIKYIINKLER